MALWILFALIVPEISPYSYSAINEKIQNQGSSMSHLFGTDKFGRDIFSRVWSAARISLTIGFASMAINGTIGIVYGSIAGYMGKAIDFLLMRIADILSSIPSLIYVILITLAVGPGMKGILIGICVAGWIDMARLVRGEVLRTKGQKYILAAQMEGIGSFRILRKHLLRNIAGPIIVKLTFLVPQAVFTEAFLSFLGLGIAPPAVSLGSMIQDTKSQIQLYPYQMLYPILILCILIFAVNLIGTGLEKKYGIGAREEV